MSSMHMHIEHGFVGALNTVLHHSQKQRANILVFQSDAESHENQGKKRPEHNRKSNSSDHKKNYQYIYFK